MSARNRASVHQHQQLRGLHEQLRPRSYFEIGLRDGRSLALSRVPTVAVDPYYVVDHELHCDVHPVRTTSDEFFARRHPFAHLREPLVDPAIRAARRLPAPVQQLLRRGRAAAGRRRA